MTTGTATRGQVEPTDLRAGITLQGTSKVFTDDRGQEVAALDDVSLTIEPGEFLVLLGPSGCGKTTLLRCLAGLETPTAGTIGIGGVTVVDASGSRTPGERQVGMVFQSYALWPHMTVAQNISYPLQSAPRSERLAKRELQGRVDELLTLMDLTSQAQRKPGQLSGGQQQRVALARAIAAGNRVVLFDEPLSNIDAKVRETLRLELRRMQRRLGFTAVYVTHDQTEALELADRIAVMRAGKIVQLGTPDEIYRTPRTRFVAEFVGTCNVVEVGEVTRAEGALAVVRTVLGPVTVGAVPDELGAAVLATRAHSWWVRASDPGPGPNVWRGTVVSRAYLGWYTELAVEVAGHVVRVWRDLAGGAPELAEGAEVWVGVSPEDCMIVADDGR